MKKQDEPFAEDAKLEMGELVESDPELYEGDNEARPKGFRKDRIAKGNNDLDLMRGGGASDPWDVLFEGSDSDRSLEDAEEHELIVKAHKKKDVKLNNSFTGPYPQDPTDFNHTDKGANAQFVYYNKFFEAAR